ncbi:MAG: YidC/Oxa1 family membrane protein insertase [Actinomycetia bacterium]|nr:YidC/Oxa1 family membrane protein insertase [Actinomycetes bacterium]
MFDPIARVLAFFYSLPVVGGSYGLAIILLTAAVMVLLMPLTLKATRSTIKMQEVQPRLKELQKKHKDDKQTLNTELMALYQEQGINPVGGCLPMLAQLPVFLVLFNVLRGLSRRVSETPFFTIADHARVEAGGQMIPGQNFDPRYLSKDSEFYVDLSQDTEMAFGPFDLAAEALDVLQSDIVRAIPYVILILFVVGTSFYQQRQVSSRRSGSAAAGINPQQEMIMKFLPLLSGIWSFVFPAGLVLYWATSNVFRIGQQAYITRAFYHDREVEAASGSGGDDGASEKGTKPDGGAKGPKSGGSGASGGGKGSTPKDGKSKFQKPKSSPNGDRSSNSSDESDNSEDPGDEDTNGNAAAGPGNREEAWAKRRQEKARVQAANRTRKEQTSRVTPKGTKPTSSKKKRKR